MKQFPTCDSDYAPTSAAPQSQPQYDPSGGRGNAALQEELGECDTTTPFTFLDKIKSGDAFSGKLPIDLSVELGEAKVGVKADVEFKAAKDGLVSCDEVTFSIEDTGTGAQTEMSFTGEGVSFAKLGINLGEMLSISLDSDKRTGSIEAGTDAMKLGYSFQGTDEEVLHFLTVKGDAMDILFATAFEKAKKQAAEAGLVFGVDLGFNGAFQVIDGEVPQMRIETLGVDLSAEIGTDVKDDKFGNFGVVAKAGVSMESDYAKGTEDDPFTTTTGKGEASVTVTLFGRPLELKIEGEGESKGTLWEKNDTQNRLLETAMEGAYLHVMSTNSERDADATNSAVRDLHSALETGWNLACDQIYDAQGVDPRDVGRFVTFDIYRWGRTDAGFDGWYVDSNHAQLNAVIARNEAARVLHERIVWRGGDADVDGTWATVLGTWSKDIELQMTDGVLVGNYSGGSMVGGQEGQWLSGTWTGDDGAKGSFSLQLQDEGKRLSGFWMHEGDSVQDGYDWIVEKKG